LRGPTGGVSWQMHCYRPRDLHEEGKKKHKGSHSKIVLWRIDTLVINSPYYLLSGGSQLAGDIISYKSPMGPFCILLIVCIL